MTRDVAIQPNRAILTSAFNRIYNPDLSISDRTQSTRNLGAFGCLRNLMLGEWDVRTDEDRAEMQKFLIRVLANAERHGVVVPVVE